MTKNVKRRQWLNLSEDAALLLRVLILREKHDGYYSHCGPSLVVEKLIQEKATELGITGEALAAVIGNAHAPSTIGRRQQ